MNQFAAIFDMDGVIAHTNPYHAEAFKAFFIKHQVEFSDEDFAEHMYGKHNSYIMSHFFGRPIAGEELLLLESEKEALFREIYQHQVEPVSGFLEFLDALKQNGFATGVATSAPRANMELIVGKLGLNPLMKSILASEDVTKHKPDPEIYLRSAENLGIPPTQCMVFEDSFSGITAGLEAGAKVIGVLTSHRIDELPPCHHYIKDYNDLTVDLVRDLIQDTLPERTTS